MRVGLLFGSFNPIHNGHIALAQWVLGEGLVGEVWLVVSPHNPLKNADDLADFHDRVAMARIAVEELDCVKVVTLEEELPRPSYTYNTIVELRKRCKDEKFVILAGSDVANGLSGWYRSEELREMVDFLFYPRGEGDVECSKEMKNAPRWDVSATVVRQGGGSAMMNKKVWKYIVCKGLYGMKTVENLSALLSEGADLEVLAEIYFQRGKLYYAQGNFGSAINDFRESMKGERFREEAQEMVAICNSILDYRYTDIYNP